MNESIKDKFMKAHALNDDELEKVTGGFTPIAKTKPATAKLAERQQLA